MRWYTRDRFRDGRYSRCIAEWKEKPTRVFDDGFATWVGPPGAFVAIFTIEEIKKKLRTAPETDLECLRYG